MIKLYPHILSCVKAGESTVVDGIPVAGDPVVITIECRYRPNTSSRIVKGADGSTVIYRGTCYTPRTLTDINTGDVVSVTDQITEATVLQVYNAQLRTRIILM